MKRLSVFARISESTETFIGLEFQERWALVLLGEVLSLLIPKLKILKLSVMVDLVVSPLKLLFFEPVTTVASYLDNKNN